LGSLPFHQAEQELPPALEQPHPASPAPPQLRDSGDPTCPGVPWGLPLGHSTVSLERWSAPAFREESRTSLFPASAALPEIREAAGVFVVFS
jgi:hypothetical protein